MEPTELNEELKKFLVGKREQARLSQQDVAARSEIYGIGRTLDQRAVSRIEQNPLGADAIKVAGYLSAVGVPPQQYYEYLAKLSYKEDKTLIRKNNNGVTEKILHALSKIARCKSIIDDSDQPYLNELGLALQIDTIDGYIRNLARKPVIGCFGHYDAGKSTLLNTIIKQDLLPTKYQPATSVVNLLMHLEDRPAALTGTVALFRKGFQPHMIHDEKLVAEHLIEQGDHSILDRLGVHHYDDSIPSDAYIAIVFTDAEILRSVWLLDTPGHLNNDDGSDTEKALCGAELVDGVIFLSTHTGFLKDGDLGFAANVIRQHPPIDADEPLRHVLFVQSHCHSEISLADVRSVGENAFKRTHKQLSELIFRAWEDDAHITTSPTPAQLTERVQPFWRENETYRTQTVARIHDMAAYLVQHQERIVASNIERAINHLQALMREAIAKLQARKANTLDRIKEVELQDARFRGEAGKLVAEFQALIDSCAERKDSDQETMRNFFEVKTSEEEILDLIKNTYEDKKEAQQGIGNYISQMLAAKLESVLKASGKTLSLEVDDLLTRWQKAAPAMGTTDISAAPGLDISTLDASGFNARAAFIGGMAGLGSLGAMALYVSTIASNLGAYILVGKAAGVLVSLGLASSVTSVTSFVAAIGGPITIGILLAVAIGYVVYLLLGGSWQKSLAKRVHEAIRKKDVWADIEQTISRFWESTETAMSAGLRELIQQTDEYIAELKKEAATEYDAPQLDEVIEIVESAVESLQDSVASSLA